MHARFTGAVFNDNGTLRMDCSQVTSGVTEQALVSLSLAVFQTRLYVGVRRLDEHAERCGVSGGSRSQLHMAHKLAGTLQQAGRIVKRCAVKESHVDVRSEYIDGGEGHIAQACNRATVMQDLADFIATFPHDLKPLPGDHSQFIFMRVHPRIDSGIAFNGTVESQQLRIHWPGHSQATTEVACHRLHETLEVQASPQPGDAAKLFTC